jgi:hypothetical protein
MGTLHFHHHHDVSSWDLKFLNTSNLVALAVTVNPRLFNIKLLKPSIFWPFSSFLGTTLATIFHCRFCGLISAWLIFWSKFSFPIVPIQALEFILIFGFVDATGWTDYFASGWFTGCSIVFKVVGCLSTYVHQVGLRLLATRWCFFTAARLSFWFMGNPRTKRLAIGLLIWP